MVPPEGTLEEEHSNKFKIGEEIQMASFNTRGTKKAGQLEYIEQYMKKTNIEVMLLS